METKDKSRNIENIIFDRDRTTTIFYFENLTAIDFQSINRLSQKIINTHQNYLRKRLVLEGSP